MNTPNMRGLDVIQANLKKAMLKIDQLTLAAVIDAGIKLRTDSQKLTPVVTGNLRNSAYVKWKGGESKGDKADIPSAVSSMVDKQEPTVAVGYSAVYAANVHENPRAGKTGGVSPSGKKYTPGMLPSGRRSKRKVYSTVGQWKFLETPFKENAAHYVKIMTERVRKGLQGGSL